MVTCFFFFSKSLLCHISLRKNLFLLLLLLLLFVF